MADFVADFVADFFNFGKKYNYDGN